MAVHQRRVHEVQSNGIRSEFVYHQHRVGVILLALGHLVAILCKHDSIHYQILKRTGVVQSSGYDIQSVEPTSALVYAFSDELPRELIVELFVAHLKGVPFRGVGHGPGFEPAIESLRDSLELSLAFLRRYGDVLDLIHVQIRNVVCYAC